MSATLNANGQSATVNQFLGNLNAQGYTGKDGAANAAMDTFGAATSLLYSGLAAAAGEPNLLGAISTIVTVVVGTATAGSVCNVVGVVAGTVAGAEAAAVSTPAAAA